MLEREQLVQLAKVVAKADKSAATAYSYENETFSYDELNETLRQEMNALGGTAQLFRENKNLIFSLIEEVMDDVLPAKVSAAYDRFAEVKQFGQGEKPIFRRKVNSKNRAKQFVTRAGLAGVYEVFKLAKASESFEVRTSAMAGAAQIGFEEFLDGRVDFAELQNIVLEGMDELIYEEIGKALKAATNQLPAINKYAGAGFNESAFDKLLMVADAYGQSTIYCTYEFAVNMVPTEGWRYTEAMKDELYRTGRLAGYKGHNVVILEQGFKDESMSEKAIDPSQCWIIPAGADTKPIKVAFEGGTLVDERQNADWSRDIQIYKKVGVTAMLTNDICLYEDTSLVTSTDSWNLKDSAAFKVVNVTA